jgi:type IV pilus assembly protein PilC
MKFKYQARTKDGELQTGNVEAADKAAANSILSGHNLFILSLESSEKISLTDKLFSFVGGVKRKDLVIFSRQLATVLQAQLSLADSLKTLKSQTENQALKEIVGEISDDVSSGLSFSQALEKHRDIFSDFFVSMVQSAEVTGSLDTAVSFWRIIWKKKIILSDRLNRR